MNRLSVWVAAVGLSYGGTGPARAKGRTTVADQAAGGSVRTWGSHLLRDPLAWPEHMENARVSSDERGLRVEVAQGKSWAIAGAWDIRLPKSSGVIRVSVSEIRGEGAWLMRLQRRSGFRSYGVRFQDHEARGQRQVAGA